MARTKEHDKANSYIPKDYEDLYLYYIQGDGRCGGRSSLCKTLLRHYLPYSSLEEQENLAHDVFFRILDKKQLGVFDPEKSNFGGVIYYVVRTVVSNFLDQRTRNPITGLHGGSIVQSTPFDKEFEPGTYSLDKLFAPEAPNRESQVFARDMVVKIFNYAKERLDISANKRDKSLLTLLELMMDGYDPKECAEELGVTPSTTYNWVAHLRGVVRTL